MELDNLTQEKIGVPAQFDRVARSYDLFTGLSPGYGRHLRLSARRLALPKRARALDLCCGTGLSTSALRKEYPDAELTALDASREMLARARTKSALRDVRFVLGDAMDPAACGATGPYDGILMAYGIRNVPDPDRCLRRLHDLLVPGGSICFHEYSVNDSAWGRLVWNAVTLGIVIPGGVVTAGDSPIYRYLRRSVLDFDGVRAFEGRLRGAGFVEVRTHAMPGWARGVVHSFLARRAR